MAAPGETPVVRGSVAWRGEWTIPDDGPAVVELDLAALVKASEQNPFATRLLRADGQTCGQLFLDGEPMPEAASEDMLATTPGSWRVNQEGTKLYWHLPAGVESPEHHLIELSVRGRLFAPIQRGLDHIHIKNLTFEHCGNQFPSGFWNGRSNGAAWPQAGAVSTRSGSHWRIEGCTIRYAKTIGLDCGGEGGFDAEGDDDRPFPPRRGEIGGHVIVRNDISDNGACGIACAGGTGVEIVGNRLERNNALGFTAPETAGIKCHFFYDGRIEGNVLRDNDTMGIWLDNQWYGTRISRNVITSSRQAGIFVELGDGPCLVDHNIIANTREGEGIYMHDASSVTVAHNLLLANAHYGLYARLVTDRRFYDAERERGDARCSNLNIRNNIFVDNYRGHLCLPPAGERQEQNCSDGNLFVSGSRWHWEGLAYHVFGVSVSNGILDAEQKKVLESLAYETCQIGLAHDGSRLVSAEVWQEQLGWDRHSVFSDLPEEQVENGAVAKGAFMVSRDGASISWPGENDVLATQVQPVSDVPPSLPMTHDFHGRPLPAGRLRPGPFQGFDKDVNRLGLVPPLTP
jgi:parallel beta-helix repeat protein